MIFSFFAFHFFRSFFLHVFLHSRFVIEKLVVVVVHCCCYKIVVVFVMMLVTMLVVETDSPIVRHRENDGGEMM